jgi:hypothetical protein
MPLRRVPVSSAMQTSSTALIFLRSFYINLEINPVVSDQGVIFILA